MKHSMPQADTRTAQQTVLYRVKVLFAAAVLVVAGFGITAPAHAHAVGMFQAQTKANNYFSDQAGVSSRQAASAARNKVGGKVISVKPRKNGKGYRVRLLVEGGRVVTVQVDATGRVINDS